MNQELINKYRVVSFVCSGFLVLWYFLDADISKINFLKDLGLQNQQKISYILICIIIFCITESLIEYSKNSHESWQSKLQMVILVTLPILSIVISYPKLTENTFLQETERLDICIPILAALFTSVVALELSFAIKALTVFYRFRKTILPNQVVSIVFLTALIAIGIASTTIFKDKNDLVAYQLRYFIFTISFLISFLSLSPKEKIFSEEKLNFLEKKSTSLDRQVETSEYISTLKKPISQPKKKSHKKIMKLIRRVEDEQKKSIFPMFIMLQGISFKEDGERFAPIVKDANDDDSVLRVNLIKKETDEILESEDIKFKYVKMACEQMPKFNYGNDIRGFLTPMASLAYSIHVFHESDQNELMLKFASSGDEYLNNLKELFKIRNPDINYIASDGWTALLISVANGEKKTAEFLLQKAADPAITTKHGAAPLHFASKYGNLALCKLLLNYHADVNQPDIDGSTPLMMAARFGHNAIVKELIQHGADPELIDVKQKTALAYATEGKYGEICKYLRKNLNT